MSKKRVSVHIASKDRSSELLACLHSLRAQTYKAWDLVLLDDGFGAPIANNFKFIHDLLGRLKLEGHGVQLLRNNISFGVCRARQKLIDEDLWKDNPYILRIDDDQVLDPDYLERLVSVMEDCPDAGMVSGVTPTFSGPDLKKSVEKVDVINKISLDALGTVIDYADDCGTLMLEDEVKPAHNFRSSALMRREMFEKGLHYEKGLSLTGFREECFLSLRSLLLGYKIYVDTGAIAWHAHCASGGCRASPEEYNNRVQMDHQKLVDWIKRNHTELRRSLV